MLHNCYFAFFLVTVSTVQCLSQCDNTIVPSSNANLAYKTREGRCEGFYSAKVAANRLKVVSFTLGDIRFQAQEDEVIEIKSPEARLKIKAEGIPNDLYYRMDAVLDKGTMIWPVKEVLFQDTRTRYARNIGILANVSDKVSHPIYVPVKVVGKKASADPSQTPLLKLVCTTRLTQLQWRVQGESTYRVLEGSSFRAFAPIYIRIPEGISGEKLIQIRAKEENGLEWLQTSLTVKI